MDERRCVRERGRETRRSRGECCTTLSHIWIFFRSLLGPLLPQIPQHPKRYVEQEKLNADQEDSWAWRRKRTATSYNEYEKLKKLVTLSSSTRHLLYLLGGKDNEVHFLGKWSVKREDHSDPSYHRIAFVPNFAGQ